eukprot:4461483-Amphidinium_carterae.1
MLGADFECSWTSCSPADAAADARLRQRVLVGRAECSNGNDRSVELRLPDHDQLGGLLSSVGHEVAAARELR